MSYKNIVNFYSKQDTETKVWSSLLAVFLFWVLCLNHTEPFNVAVTYNSLNGNIGFQTNGGWHLTNPFVRTSEITCKPLRVSLSTSVTSYGKIVKFVLTPEALTEFVKLEGFHYDYNHYTLIPYVFSGKKFPFFEILDDECTSSEKNYKQ
jgi:hypothetical protein